MSKISRRSLIGGLAAGAVAAVVPNIATANTQQNSKSMQRRLLRVFVHGAFVIEFCRNELILHAPKVFSGALGKDGSLELAHEYRAGEGIGHEAIAGETYFLTGINWPSSVPQGQNFQLQGEYYPSTKKRTLDCGDEQCRFVLPLPHDAPAGTRIIPLDPQHPQIFGNPNDFKTVTQIPMVLLFNYYLQPSDRPSLRPYLWEPTHYERNIDLHLRAEPGRSAMAGHDALPVLSKMLGLVSAETIAMDKYYKNLCVPWKHDYERSLFEIREGINCPPPFPAPPDPSGNPSTEGTLPADCVSACVDNTGG